MNEDTVLNDLVYDLRSRKQPICAPTESTQLRTLPETRGTNFMLPAHIVSVLLWVQDLMKYKINHKVCVYVLYIGMHPCTNQHPRHKTIVPFMVTSLILPSTVEVVP